MPTGAGLISSIGAGSFKMAFNMLYIVVGIVILGTLYFVGRLIGNWNKRRKNFKITACIYNPDGTFFLQKIGKFKGEDNIDKMIFQKTGETMPVINPKHIINLRVTLWRYGVGQYAVIPPKMWGQDPKNFKIDVIDMQMKNFAYLEQRAAVSRWAYIKDLLTKYGPYIAMLIMAIAACVIVWLVMKTSIGMYNDVVTARLMECKELLKVGQVTPLV